MWSLTEGKWGQWNHVSGLFLSECSSRYFSELGHIAPWHAREIASRETESEAGIGPDILGSASNIKGHILGFGVGSNGEQISSERRSARWRWDALEGNRVSFSSCLYQPALLRHGNIMHCSVRLDSLNEGFPSFPISFPLSLSVYWAPSFSVL